MNFVLITCIFIWSDQYALNELTKSQLIGAHYLLSLCIYYNKQQWPHFEVPDPDVNELAITSLLCSSDRPHLDLWNDTSYQWPSRNPNAF